MFTKKIIVLLIILLFLLPTISSNVLSGTFTNNNDSNSNKGLIWKLLEIRFKLGFIDQLMMGRYFYQQLRPPVPIQCYPDSVDLRYLNNTLLSIGGKNPITLEWESMVKVAGSWSFAWFNPRTIFRFEFVPPEDAPGDVWNVQFDPEHLIMDTNMENLDWPGAEDPFRTNVTIMLKPSADPTYPSQDIVLKVNIVRTEILDHNRIRSGYPKWVNTHREEYEEKMTEMDPNIGKFWSNPINRFVWNRVSRRFFFLTNLQFPPSDTWVDSTVEILVRVNRYHQARIDPPLPQEIEPYEVKSIPITITNLGSHIDTFNFKVKTSDKNMVVTPPPVITLMPGEEAQALVGVAAPKNFLAIGSTSSILVEAFSVSDPNSVFSNTIILSTVGIHATGGPTYNFISLLITLFIFAAILFYFIRKRREKISRKPDKPWNIPEEKQYLEKLNEKDKKKYNETLKMMEDEYESSMLWYKYYCDATLRKRKIPRKKIEIKIDFKKLSQKLEEISKGRKAARKKKLKVKKEKSKAVKEKSKIKKEKLKVKEEKNFFKNLKLFEKKPVEEPKKVVEPKKVEKIEPEKVIKKEKIVDRTAELERLKKQRVISRIKREQDKQIRSIEG